MRRVIVVSVLVLALFAVNPLSWAAVPQQLPVAAKILQISGEVKAVHGNSMSFTVAKKCKSKTLEIVVTVNDKTIISRDNTKVSFSDLRNGDKVVVKYTEAAGRNLAQNITIERPQPKTEDK